MTLLKSRPSANGPARMALVQPPVIPIVAELAQKTPGVISLGQGVVYYGPPPRAIARIEDFLKDNQNHKYKPVLGLPDLIKLLETKVEAENGISLASGYDIAVTAGGNQAFLNALLAITDPGDEIILQQPYYFNHDMAIAMVGCKPVYAETDDAYRLDLNSIERAISNRTRAIVTVSPNNPTGAVYSEPSLRSLNALCAERAIYHIHDEAYEYFTYGDARHFSPGAIEGAASRTICLYSLSKAYGFASWRIGYMCAPRHLFASLKKIQDTVLICPPVISQFAAMGAIEEGRGYFESKFPQIERVRKLLLDRLQSLAPFCRVPAAEGAFYLLLQLDTRKSPMNVVERLIREHGVAAIPGNAFGNAPSCQIRVAYGALDSASAEEGVERLVKGLKAVAG